MTLFLKLLLRLQGGSPNDLAHHAAWELIHQNRVWQEGKKALLQSDLLPEIPLPIQKCLTALKSSIYTLLLNVIAG